MIFYQFSVDDPMNSTFVYNPINAYHLVKRIINHLPKITNNIQIHKMLTNVSKEIMFQQISNGLYQIEEHSYSTPSDIIEGIIQATPTSRKYHGNKKLEFDDVIAISKIARKFGNFDKEISWLEIALKLSPTVTFQNRLR